MATANDIIKGAFGKTGIYQPEDSIPAESTTQALAALNDWPAAGTVLYASGQVLREYMVVATRGLEQNGLGLNREDALADVAEFRSRLRVLKAALVLRDRRPEISAHGFAVARGRIEARMNRLLSWRPTWSPNRKFLRHLRNERPHLFTFLYRPEIEATNWPAEQAIRPAVITRKVCGGGNRTDRGVYAQQILASIIRTCVQQGRDALEIFVRAFHARRPIRFALAHGPSG